MTTITWSIRVETQTRDRICSVKTTPSRATHADLFVCLSFFCVYLTTFPCQVFVLSLFLSLSLACFSSRFLCLPMSSMTVPKSGSIRLTGCQKLQKPKTTHTNTLMHTKQYTLLQCGCRRDTSETD